MTARAAGGAIIQGVRRRRYRVTVQAVPATPRQPAGMRVFCTDMPCCIFLLTGSSRVTVRISSARSLSELGDRSEPSGRARSVFRSFEENSRSYLTRRIGKLGRCPAGAVDQSQIRQALDYPVEPERSIRTTHVTITTTRPVHRPLQRSRPHERSYPNHHQANTGQTSTAHTPSLLHQRSMQIKENVRD